MLSPKGVKSDTEYSTYDFKKRINYPNFENRIIMFGNSFSKSDTRSGLEYWQNQIFGYPVY